MATGEQKRGRKRGRPAWAPPDLSLVRALATQGMTSERIAETLGIGVSTLYRKKAQLREFREAIKRGAAEGEAVVSSKLFEKAKAGNVVAMIFWLKARAGWRDLPDPREVNVNIGMGGMTAEQREEEMAKQRELISLLTVDERRTYLELMERAARRQREGMPAIEVRPLTVEEIEAEAAELEREGK